MPSATALQFQRVAGRLGFVFVRSTGSHERWIHPDGRSVTIPVHGGKGIGPPLLFKILRQLGVHLASPYPRSSHAMAYDAARGQVVLCGGFAGPFGSLSGLARRGLVPRPAPKRSSLRFPTFEVPPGAPAIPASRIERVIDEDGIF